MFAAQIYQMIYTQAKNKDQTQKFSYKNQLASLQNRDQNNRLNTISGRVQTFNYKHLCNTGSSTYNFSALQSMMQQGLEGSKEYLWITDKGRQLFQTKSSWKNNLGPGKYTSLCPSERHHSNWPKSKRFNYQKTQIPTVLGPGLYQTGNNEHMKERSLASSAFKSKTTKSYLADKISELRKLRQVNVNPEVQFEPLETQAYFENQNHYQRNQFSRRINGSPVFVSKCERLPTLQASNVGPGSYIVQKARKKSPEIVKRLLTEPRTHVLKENVIKKHQSHKQLTAGPESYSKDEDLELIKRKVLLGTIVKDKRFKQLSKKRSGQGNYQLTKKRVQTQKNVSSPKRQEKVGGTERLIGTLVRKAFTRNREYTKSQMNVFKLFRNFEREKKTVENVQQNK